MAKVMVFYIPTRHQTKVKWVAPQQRPLLPEVQGQRTETETDVFMEVEAHHIFLLVSAAHKIADSLSSDGSDGSLPISFSSSVSALTLRLQ
jgi:hypothetical protein